MGTLDLRRVLVLDDEPLVGLLLTDDLEMAGATVIGPALTTSDALALLRREPVDAAVLDYRLGNGLTSSAVGRALAMIGVPFLFYTGSPEETASAHPGVPILEKPAHSLQLVAAVHKLVGGRTQG